MAKNSLPHKEYKLTEDESINKKFSLLIEEMELAEKNKRPFELYIFTWSLIEEILVPELVKFVAKNLRMDPPSAVFKLSQISINYFYLAISGGDKELFEKLENARKTRNTYVHKLVISDNIIDMDTKVRRELKNLSALIRLIQVRQTGKKAIPSINRYYLGWNDAIEKCLETIRKY